MADIVRFLRHGPHEFAKSSASEKIDDDRIVIPLDRFFQWLLERGGQEIDSSSRFYMPVRTAINLQRQAVFASVYQMMYRPILGIVSCIRFDDNININKLACSPIGWPTKENKDNSEESLSITLSNERAWLPSTFSAIDCAIIFEALDNHVFCGAIQGLILPSFVKSNVPHSHV